MRNTILLVETYAAGMRRHALAPADTNDSTLIQITPCCIAHVEAHTGVPKTSECNFIWPRTLKHLQKYNLAHTLGDLEPPICAINLQPQVK